MYSLSLNTFQKMPRTHSIPTETEWDPSLWLWLLPIVVGWLQFSPNCDSIRLHQAVDRVNSIAHVANSTSQPIKAENLTGKRAVDLARSELDEARRDERSTPPIYDSFRGPKPLSLCPMQSGSSVSKTVTTIQLTPGPSGGIEILEVVIP